MPAGAAATSTSTTAKTSTEPVALVVLVASAVLAAQVVLAAQAVSVAQAALASLVALAAQAVQEALASPVVPSPRGVAARGLTTLRIEAVPPTPMPNRTASMAARTSAAAQGPAIARPAEARASGVGVVQELPVAPVLPTVLRRAAEQASAAVVP